MERYMSGDILVYEDPSFPWREKVNYLVLYERENCSDFMYMLLELDKHPDAKSEEVSRAMILQEFRKVGHVNIPRELENAKTLKRLLGKIDGLEQYVQE
jgi:hypothetical protein